MSLKINNKLKSMRLFMKHKHDKNLSNNQVSNNKAQALAGNSNNKAQAMTGNSNNKAQAFTGNRGNKALSDNKMNNSVMGGLSGTAKVDTRASAQLDSHKRIIRNKGNKYYQSNSFPPGYVDHVSAMSKQSGYELGQADQKVNDIQKMQKQSDELQDKNSEIDQLKQEVKDLKTQKNPQPEIQHAPKLAYNYTLGGSHHYQIPYNVHPHTQTYHDGYDAGASYASKTLDDGKEAESADDIIAPKIDFVDSPKLYTMSNKRLSKVPSTVEGLYGADEPSKSDDDDLEK